MAVSPPLDFSQQISLWEVTFVPWYSWDFLAENILLQLWQFCFCFWHIWGCSCFSFDISLLQFSPLTVQFCPDWTFLQIKFRNQIELCSWCCCFTFAVFFFFTIKFYPIFSGVFIYIVIFCGCISLMIFWYICISQLQFSPLTVQFCLPQPLVKDGTGEIMMVDLWTSYLSLCLWLLIYICLFVCCCCGSCWISGLVPNHPKISWFRFQQNPFQVHSCGLNQAIAISGKVQPNDDDDVFDLICILLGFLILQYWPSKIYLFEVDA